MRGKDDKLLKQPPCSDRHMIIEQYTRTGWDKLLEMTGVRPIIGQANTRDLSRDLLSVLRNGAGQQEGPDDEGSLLRQISHDVRDRDQG